MDIAPVPANDTGIGIIACALTPANETGGTNTASEITPLNASGITGTGRFANGIADKPIGIGIIAAPIGIGIVTPAAAGKATGIGANVIKDGSAGLTVNEGNMVPFLYSSLSPGINVRVFSFVPPPKFQLVLLPELIEFTGVIAKPLIFLESDT
jgi:hypothetical protein